jgi:hypothetical protein
MSFENSIQSGYVTEKLFAALVLPSIPVYYGSGFVPNITSTPSFIKVREFRNPKHLADYMLYLDKSPEEYAKYGAWRRNAGKDGQPKSSAFSREFLDTMSTRVPGPKEMQLHHGSEREAQCCRLCDEQFVKWANDRPKKDRLVRPAMSEDDIAQYFFDGFLGKYHGR